MILSNLMNNDESNRVTFNERVPEPARTELIEMNLN